MVYAEEQTKILDMEDGRWAKKVYEESRAAAIANPALHNWCSYTRYRLLTLGFADAWRSQSPPAHYRSSLDKTVFNREQDEWRDRMTSKSKLFNYRSFKTQLTHEK